VDHKKEYVKCHVERDQKVKVKHVVLSGQCDLKFEKKVNRIEFCQRDHTDIQHCTADGNVLQCVEGF
jgi:hypothetical protein